MLARARPVRHRPGRGRDRRPRGRRSRTSRAPTACWRAWRGCAPRVASAPEPARGVLVKAPKSGQDLRYRPADRRPAHRRGRGQGRTCRDCGRRRQHHRRRAAGHDRGRRQGRPVRARALPRDAAAQQPAQSRDKIFLIATEESGDRLGANLMKVLRQRLGGAVRFEGVGGRAMAREGLTRCFPIEELSIIGPCGGGEAIAEDPAADPRNRGRGDASARRTSSSSSTAPISPIAWPPGACHAIRASRSSITSRPRSGRGGRAGRARCCPMSITCWRCCRSSRRPIAGCAGRPAAMSAIP